MTRVSRSQADQTPACTAGQSPSLTKMTADGGPADSGLQTRATSRLGYCSLQTGGPMGARVSSLTGQWEVGRCKGWHPSVQPVLQIQNTDRGNLQQSLGVQSLVCRHPGSITDHNQPLFLARGGSTHSGHCPRPSLSGQNLCSEK